MNSGNRMNSNLSSLDDDTRAGSRGGGGGGSAENRLLDDSASSDGGLGGRTKRSHGDSQGDGSKDEPRRKRHVTTPHREYNIPASKQPGNSQL